MRYVLDFGSANASTTPTFDTFKNADTLTDVSAPSLVEIGDGLFYFDYTWSSPSITSITYKASVNGVELSDVITSDTATSGSTAVGAASGVNPWLWTAGQILNMVATEVGLSEASDPYASTNATFVQLRTLLKTAGDEISKARDWRVLEREATVTGDGSTTSFALPSDFLRMKDDTGWNRTTTFPLGLTGPQQWQSLKAQTVTGTVATLYRIQRGRMVFYEAPADGDSIVYEYLSRFWVASDGASEADSYFPSAAGDVVMFEPLLVMRLVKAKFLQAKGFDSSGAFAEYQQALNDAGNLEPAPTLAVGGNGGSFPLAGNHNWPTRLG